MKTVKDRLNLIRNALNQHLNPHMLTINDESHLHIGHANEGAGHFSIEIVCQTFEGKTPVQRHKMIYEALGDLMKTDIHAITIVARSPNEE